MNRNTGNKYTKIVEWHLFREKEIRQAVMEARLDSASSGNSSGKVISNPTEKRSPSQYSTTCQGGAIGRFGGIPARRMADCHQEDIRQP